MSAGASRGTGIHATAVVFGDCGVVIVGPSGSGKSALALALLACARSTGQFGALIGDDRVWVRAAAGRLVAAGAPHTAGLIERRSAGLQQTPSEPAAVIRLVVELSEPGRSWPRFPSERDDAIVAGVGFPRLALNSGAAAADLALSVVERLQSIDIDRGVRRGISLEQSDAVHKNKGLATSRTASTTTGAEAGPMMDI